MRGHEGYENFAPEFFRRTDEFPDRDFYAPPRLVQHIDDGAIAAVGALYQDLDINRTTLDLMGSWVSHFIDPPSHLTVLGMNAHELQANPQATATLVHDLNEEPQLPWPDDSFDDAVCTVSVDYLVQPLEVFEEVRRVLRPGGRFVCTFSNRCFPTKAIRGWLVASESFRTEIVATYFRLTGWSEPRIETRVQGGLGDPLYAVWSTAPGSPTSVQEF